MRKMGKDPLEDERRFRQIIGRAAEARRQSRWPRRWLRTLALPFLKRPGLTLLLVLLLCFGGFLAVIFGVAIKWTDVYACSLAEARRSPVVIAELGEPTEAGFFAWTYGYSQQGSVTDASFRTTLSGPKGEGTLRVQWYRSPLGSSLRMELEKDGKRQLVYSGAVPCR
jgi:hypothetical protein